MPAETKLFLVCRKTGKIVGFNRRGWRFKVLFPLLGVLALVWYLLRVLPKPSRASYPCQRVGAPIAFGGLAYLLSVCGLATAWHHGRKFIRQNRYTLAGACLVVGLVCGAMVRNYCESRAMAATESTGSFVPVDPPDTPIGTARGIYPGRVAWSYNTNACNWDGVSSYWWSTQFNNQTEITKLMDNVICSVAGQQSVSNAWDALFRAKNGGPTALSYVKGQSIVIKINENNGGDSNMIDASPQSVYALLDSLVNQFGASQSDITICDPARAGDNAAVLAYCQSAFPNVNLNTSSAGNFTANAFAYSVNFSGTTGTIENSMATAVVNAKYLITMALLKRHAMPYPTYGDSFNDGNAPATMIFKSDWGIIGNNRSNQHVMLHTWEKPNASYDLLVDIYGSTNINGKTVLHLLDGLYSGFLWNSGPTNWVIPPFNGHYPSSMFASQDPVALESVGIDFMWADFGMVSNADRTVREAALANNPPSGTVYQPDGVRLKSLGVHENWNNATNKQFSRNLGTGLGIELVTIKPGVPSVSILGMASGNTYTPGTNLPLQALVLNTNYPVSQVAYYQGGQLLGTATTSPYTVTLTNMALGNYAFTAVATDTSGLAVTSNPVNINVSVYTGPVTYTWDAGSGHSGGNDGGGSWDLATADWWNGTTNVVWSNTTQPALTSFGVSNGPAGTVTLGSSITVSNLNFSPAASGNYTLAGGGTLTFANDPTLSVAANCAPVISAPVTGAGFIYAGPGALTLSGANTLGGTLAVTGGTLALIGNNTGSTAGGTVAGGATLQVANGFTGPLTLNSGSKLQLRGDANTTFSPSAINLDNAADIYTFDAGPLTTATGNTLTLNAPLTFLDYANQLINLTGSNTYTLALGNIIGTTTGHNPYVDIALNTLANGPAVTIGSFQSGNWSQWLQLQGGGRITITGNITNVSNGSSIVYVTDGTMATMQGRSSFSPTATATADAYKYCVAHGALVLDNGYALTNNTSGTGLTASYFLLGAATNVFAVSGTFSPPAGVMVNTNNSWNAAVYLGDSTHLTGGITLNAKTTNNVSDGDIGFVNSGVMTIGGQNTSGTNTYANTIILGLTANKGKSATLVAATGGEVDFAGPILANGTDTTAGITVGDALHGGTVKLLAANTYAGGTTVANGTLLVNNTTGSGTGTNKMAVNSGGLLGGAGIIAGAVTVNAGAALAPSGVPGILTISNNLTLAAGSTTYFQIKASPLTNNGVKVGGLLTAGGTLNVTNIGAAPPAAGASFKLFTAGGYSGGFSGVTLPALAPGLGWNTNSLNTAGQLSVISIVPKINTVTSSGANLVFSGGGGQPRGYYYVLCSTNLMLPFASWTCVATDYYDAAGNFCATNALTPDLPQLFYLLQAP